MSAEITFPGPLVLRAAGCSEQDELRRPDWGVYADACWDGWPGEVLDWPDVGVPRDNQRALDAIIQALGRAQERQDILIGCRGGVGRTGTLLAAMAVATGVPAERARGWVRQRYRPHAVETEPQHRWVKTVVAHDNRILKHAKSTKQRRVKAVTSDLQAEMRSALKAGRRRPILAWAVPDRLAVTQRPLRAHPIYWGSRRDYPREARSEIDAWIADLVEQGVRSVVLLTSDKELRHYDPPTVDVGGLRSLYHTAGLQTVHFPFDDPAHDLTAKAAFGTAVDELATEIAHALRGLAPPAVLHCSAAIDRSPPIAARIAFLAEVDAL
jgi:protein-tyrosine phosphatase